MKKTSVVIVNYNVRELILTCLRTLYAFHPEEDLEVIVVDNQSSDGSVEAIRNEFPQVILIANTTNAGFPKANNQGFEIATGDYIFMLNPDTEFIQPAISSLRMYLDTHPEYAFVAPKLLNTDRSIQGSIWRYPSLTSVFCESFYLHAFLKKKNYADKDRDHVFEVETCSGAAIYFRKSLLERIGNLDETMFWIEDVEFCFRANHAGEKGVYLPEAQIVHHIGQSAKKNYNISLSNQVFNKIKFFGKHHGVIQTTLVKLISLIHVLYKILVFGLLSPLKVIYWRKFKAYCYTLPKVFNPPKGIA